MVDEVGVGVMGALEGVEAWGFGSGMRVWCGFGVVLRSLEYYV